MAVGVFCVAPESTVPETTPKELPERCLGPPRQG